MAARHRPRDAGDLATDWQDRRGTDAEATGRNGHAEPANVEPIETACVEEDTSSLEPPRGADSSAATARTPTTGTIGDTGGYAALSDRPADDTHSPLYEYLVSSQRLQRRSHSKQKLKILRLELIVVASLALLGGLIGGLMLLRMSIENDRLISQVASLETTNATLGNELATVSGQRDRLVQGRHPSLLTLTMDQNLIVDSDYVRSIIFSRVGHDGETHYEFRALLENRESMPLVPSLSVLLFDAVGVQIGRADLDLSRGPADNLLLEPREARAYHGEVKAAIDSEPSYFRVIVR